jgi:phosphatidate phosphatase APP1
MAKWQEAFTHLAHDIEQEFDRRKYNLYDRLGGHDPVKIVPYNGYGNQQRLHFKARVLEDQGIAPAMDNDSLWENLINMYRRLESDEIPHAHVLVRFQDQAFEVEADEEGFLTVDVEVHQPLPTDRIWHSVELELLEPRPRGQAKPATAKAEILVPPKTAEYVVVSDIDDTVLISDANHVIKMARNVFMSNAHTRLPFPGVAAFYRALYSGSSGQNWNPLFFVSSSPWNLYDLLVDFFHLQNIPVGPVLFLRDWGITENELLPTNHRAYKQATIEKMLSFYPDLPFILVGDSGQEDPEVYSGIIDRYPKRIMATYIRNVSRNLKREEEINLLAKKAVQAGSDLILAKDTVAIAEHALHKGWIQAERMPEIMGEKVKDEAPAGPIEKLVGGEKEPGPVVAIEAETPAEKKEVKQAIDQGVIGETLQEAGDTGKQQPPTVVVKGDPQPNEKKPDES